MIDIELATNTNGFEETTTNDEEPGYYIKLCNIWGMQSEDNWVIPYQFTEVSHVILSDSDKIWFMGSPSGHM